MSKDTLTAAQWRQMNSKQPKKSTTEKKVQSAKELMDISVTELGHLIDQTLIKAAKYVEYYPEKIECRIGDLEVEIVFKVKKP